MPGTEHKTGLAALLPELGDRPTALTTGGFFLVRLPKGCLAVFTEAEYRQALRRGKAVLRSGRHHARLAREAEKRDEAWLRKTHAERGFITAEELLSANLGNGPGDSPETPECRLLAKAKVQA